MLLNHIVGDSSKQCVRVSAEVFKNKTITETTRKSIIQVLVENFKQLIQSSRAVELESNYNEEVKLRREAEDTLAKKKEEVKMMERLLKSYKEEQGKLQLQAQALEQKYEAETVLAIELERIENLKLPVENLENERDDMRLKAEEFESNYDCEMVLRNDSVIALDREREELEVMKQQLESWLAEQENLTSQVRAWHNKYVREFSLRKETEDTLNREKQELESVKRLLESYSLQADAMREERDSALRKAQEVVEERQPPTSFFCPITRARPLLYQEDNLR